MALGADVLVVEVSKGTAHAPPPTCRPSNGKRTVAAYREAAGVDGARLRWPVKLELAIGNNRSRAVILIVQDTVFECAE